MDTNLKLVLNRIPKGWFYSSMSSLILGFFFLIINSIAFAQPIVNEMLIGLIFLVSVVLIILIFLILIIKYVLLTIEEKNEKDLDLVTAKPIKKTASKKNIRRHIELQTLNNNLWEIKVSVKRKWWPSEQMPNIEDFLKALEFSEPYCGLCKSNIESNYSSSIRYSRCSNFECKNSNEQIPSTVVSQLKSTLENQFAGDIRNDYEKYWDIYTTIYLGITDGKPEEFQDPIN